MKLNEKLKSISLVKFIARLLGKSSKGGFDPDLLSKPPTPVKKKTKAEIRKYESYMVDKSRLEWKHYFEEANKLDSTGFQDRSFSSVCPSTRTSTLASARTSKLPSSKAVTPLPPRPIAA